MNIPNVIINADTLSGLGVIIPKNTNMSFLVCLEDILVGIQKEFDYVKIHNRDISHIIQNKLNKELMALVSGGELILDYEDKWYIPSMVPLKNLNTKDLYRFLIGK